MSDDPPTTDALEGLAYDHVSAAAPDLAAKIFDADPRVHAVGVTTAPAGGFALGAIRNIATVLPMSVRIHSLDRFGEIPVLFSDALSDPAAQLKVPASGPGSPTAASLVPEQGRRRPLVCGLQVQNFDDDQRQGILPNYITIGTLGCFVKASDGSTAILSNNHVLAGENRGQKGTDRILQPGGTSFDADDHVATLQEFVDLRPSPPGAKPIDGSIVWNVIDAALATLLEGTKWTQGYLPIHQGLPKIRGFTTPRIGDRVFKVGRTTGLTWGEIRFTGLELGPVAYDTGPCWFDESFGIVGEHGSQFSDRGDSGSAIIKHTGEIVGLLYAGNGTQTFACPIEKVFQNLACTLP